ncbi:ABC transporter ATP-binding protein [Salipaludibacillus aurantiacus]|uniref:Iron complex transport system ATP-binding protein n=1 Tax=Salipaludibacillus aurantiacus TaxID=1601833 RepID=A0A1H9UA47_9BACI|nr:ABC transporter ATP-binding protein [Salipaludibacillus aurantiacus]SES06118.1 iron complex transport system ATP-binding protein [Salipaludibacillus aurantiacus]
MKSLEAKDVRFSYDDKLILNDLTVTIPKGKITVFIGGNGCGKSTLLRTMARLLKTEKGMILLDGEDISTRKTKDIAKQMSILPQGPSAPEGLSVEQLVKQGRYPHQSFLKQWSLEDEKMVSKALRATGMTEHALSAVDELSGGQRQRAWIAMTLAQGSDTLLLDEPTTYLDMSHQIDVLDLLYELNEKEQRTVVMVLHDMNLACRYAHHLVAMRNKTIYDAGAPDDIMTKKMVRDVFNMECMITNDPIFGSPMVIPHGKGRMADESSIRAKAK